jgi:hypothetical protein
MADVVTCAHDSVTVTSNITKASNDLFIVLGNWFIWKV